MPDQYDPYTIEVKPGGNASMAAKRASKYVIDRWMPRNAGGVHVLMGSHLTATFESFFALANRHGRPVDIRVTFENHRPVLTVV